MKLIAKWAGNILILAMFIAPLVGFGMAIYTDNTNWLWLCGFLLIFLS